MRRTKNLIWMGLVVIVFPLFVAADAEDGCMPETGIEIPVEPDPLPDPEPGH